MRMPFTLAIGILCLSMGSPGSTGAAPNPDLEALAQGSVVQFSGTERISQPFVFDLDITAPHPALDFDNIVGRPFQIAVARGRAVAGMVERVEQRGVSGRQGQYRIRLVPAPNCPVVLGSMWNGKDLSPTQQPPNKFLSLFQSRSTTGTLNEILFDATQDKERLIMRSGNQYLSLSPQGITASTAITVPTTTVHKLQSSPRLNFQNRPNRYKPNASGSLPL